MKVLVVDNDAQNCRFLERVLKEEGHQVKTAGDGAEALRLLKEDSFTGIMTEVLLPRMDGIKLLWHITQESTPNIPFLFFNETLDRTDAPLFDVFGADFIPKSEMKTPSQVKKALDAFKISSTPTDLKEASFLQHYNRVLRKILDCSMEYIEEIEKKLSQSQIKYRKLFEGAHDATFIMDRQGGHIEANKKASQLLGYTLEEFRRLSFKDIVVPDSIPDSEKKLKRLLRGEDLPVYEKKFRAKDGTVIPVEVSVSGVEENPGRVTYIQSIVRDITERKRTEKALGESEEKYRSLIEHLNVGVYRVSPGEKGQFIDMNRAFVRMLGYKDKKEMLKLKVSDIYVNPKDRKKFHEKICTQGYVKNEELLLKRKDGTPLVISDSATPVYDAEGTLLYFDGIVEDVTERKKMEKALKESEEKYRTLVENFEDSIVIIDLEGNVQFANKATEDLTGYTLKEGLGMNVSQITPVEYWPKSLAMLEKAMTGAPIPYFESVIQRKDKKCVPVESGGQAIFKDGKIVGIQIITRDITERKQAEEKIKASLKEKEVLLKEIHHRVKNNMQIICSLLNLQSTYVENEQLLEAFKESQNRIKSMALVHEKLYQSKDLASVDFREYVKSLVRSLLSSFRADPERITLDIDVRKVSLSSDQAIPCGLIINELVSNCLKHAFPEGSEGTIVVRLFPADAHTIELVVADNGIGISEKDFENTKSLGLRLVVILAEDQLKGTMRVEENQGTEIHITFDAINTMSE